MGIPAGKAGLYKRRERYNLLAGWYGNGRADVEIAAHTFQPLTIQEVIDDVLLEPGKGNNINVVSALQAQWKELVGCSFAACTAPQALRDGKLTVAVRHSALISELSLSKDLFLKAVNKLTDGECKDIVFTIGAVGKK